MTFKWQTVDSNVLYVPCSLDSGSPAVMGVRELYEFQQWREYRVPAHRKLLTFMKTCSMSAVRKTVTIPSRLPNEEGLTQHVD